MPSKPRRTLSLGWRLAEAMVLSSLLTIFVIFTAFMVFTIARFPPPNAQVAEKARPVRQLLNDPNTRVRIIVESDSQRYEMRVPDVGREALNALLPDGPGAPAWVIQTLGVGVAFSVALSLLNAFLTSKRIAKPVEAVSEASNRMGHGDLSVRAPVHTERGAVLETITLAENFNAMADALDRSERERRSMIADIAHELRTPLAVMTSRLQAIDDDLIPFDRTEAQKLMGHTQLLARLVNDLRTLSLADSNQLETRRREFDLVTTTQDLISSFTARATPNNQQLRLESPEHLTVSADQDRIMQIMTNLIENALRHTPSGGTVTVRLTPGSQVRIEVLDTGPGIPEEHLERVFARFHRIDPSRSRSSGGSGLGLAIVKAIAELHGGSVSVSNRPEGGAAFTVTLPQA